jgi:hypothetical protein
MIEFRYHAERVHGAPPPSLPALATYRWRPMLSLRLIGPGGRSRFFPRVVVDTGSADVIFPWTMATLLGAPLLPASMYQLRWRGTGYPMRFASMTMEISSRTASCRWSAVVAFSSAPIPFPLFGVAGGLEFFDATFRGEDHLVELTPNRSFPGSTQIQP